MTREQALENAAYNYKPGSCYVLASYINATTGRRIYYTARNSMEAQRWLNCNADYREPGSDMIESRRITADGDFLR